MEFLKYLVSIMLLLMPCLAIQRQPGYDIENLDWEGRFRLMARHFPGKPSFSQGDLCVFEANVRKNGRYISQEEQYRLDWEFEFGHGKLNWTERWLVMSSYYPGRKNFRLEEFREFEFNVRINGHYIPDTETVEQVGVSPSLNVPLSEDVVESSENSDCPDHVSLTLTDQPVLSYPEEIVADKGAAAGEGLILAISSMNLAPTKQAMHSVIRVIEPKFALSIMSFFDFRPVFKKLVRKLITVRDVLKDLHAFQRNYLLCMTSDDEAACRLTAETPLSTDDDNINRNAVDIHCQPDEQSGRTRSVLLFIWRTFLHSFATVVLFIWHFFTELAVFFYVCGLVCQTSKHLHRPVNREASEEKSSEGHALVVTSGMAKKKIRKSACLDMRKVLRSMQTNGMARKGHGTRDCDTAFHCLTGKITKQQFKESSDVPSVFSMEQQEQQDHFVDLVEPYAIKEDYDRDHTEVANASQLPKKPSPAAVQKVETAGWTLRLEQLVLDEKTCALANHFNSAYSEVNSVVQSALNKLRFAIADEDKLTVLKGIALDDWKVAFNSTFPNMLCDTQLRRADSLCDIRTTPGGPRDEGMSTATSPLISANSETKSKANFKVEPMLYELPPAFEDEDELAASKANEFSDWKLAIGRTVPNVLCDTQLRKAFSLCDIRTARHGTPSKKPQALTTFSTSAKTSANSPATSGLKKLSSAIESQIESTAPEKVELDDWKSSEFGNTVPNVLCDTQLRQAFSLCDIRTTPDSSPEPSTPLSNYETDDTPQPDTLSPACTFSFDDCLQKRLLEKYTAGLVEVDPFRIHQVFLNNQLCSHKCILKDPTCTDSNAAFTRRNQSRMLAISESMNRAFPFLQELVGGLESLEKLENRFTEKRSREAAKLKMRVANYKYDCSQKAKELIGISYDELVVMTSKVCNILGNNKALSKSARLRYRHQINGTAKFMQNCLEYLREIEQKVFEVAYAIMEDYHTCAESARNKVLTDPRILDDFVTSMCSGSH